MTIQEECRLSFYRKIAEISDKNHVSLVQHIETKQIYVKKELKIYNRSVYEELLQIKNGLIPNIVECIENDDILIIIEEYIQGITLTQYIEQNIDKSLYDWLNLFLDICRGIQEFHERPIPILHRDIKPSNIMVTKDGRICFIDINTARYYKEGQEKDTVIIGTRYYAAPEQYGYWQTDVRTDIYALGVLLNYMIEREYPEHIITDGLAGDIVKKCIAFEPNQRYSSISLLMYDIESLLGLSHSKVEKDKKIKAGRYLLPGFRTGKKWKYIVALFGYFMMGYISFTTIFYTEEHLPYVGAELWANRCAVFLSMIFCVVLWFNYLDVHKKLPLLKSRSKLKKIAGYVIYTVVAVFLPVSVLSMLNI